MPLSVFGILVMVFFCQMPKKHTCVPSLSSLHKA